MLSVALVLGFSALWLLLQPRFSPVGPGHPVADEQEPKAAPGPDNSYALLVESQDPSLQMQLEGIIRRQGLWSAAERGELALLLAIITDPARPRVAQLNGDRMMYAASLPKIAILFGAAAELEQGRLQLTPALEKDMTDMIRVSCNECATRVLEQVGREDLIQLLEAPEYAFYDPQNGGGLWVGKDYAPTEAYHRDPLHGLSHGATAIQVARFYYRLHTGTLVGPEQTQLMLDALSKPGIAHKFVKGLKGIPGIDMLRKSGTWKSFHADSALVRYKDQTYIMVGLVNNENGEKWLSQLASPLNDLVRAEGRNTRRLAQLSKSAANAPTRPAAHAGGG